MLCFMATDFPLTLALAYTEVIVFSRFNINPVIKMQVVFFLSTPYHSTVGYVTINTSSQTKHILIPVHFH